MANISMSPNDIINNIKNSYSEKKLNEADTRYKIIDEVIINILNWPKDSTALEFIINGNRADYILYKKNQKPAIVIESKKSGKYFELPKNFNSDSFYQKITVEKLITDKYIKEAVFQVKEYCEDLGCSYGCVSNGFVWIIFNINSTYAPWKKQPAFVIRDLNFFSDNFTTAYNILGYLNIVSGDSLKQNIGVSRVVTSEIYYPKAGINTYEMPVNSNQFAGIFNSISRKYLSNIPLEDKDFFNKCYVTNKGHYDDLQKNVRGVIYDSLTPYFISDGVKDIHDNNQGGNFAIKIEKIIKAENLDNVMILFGGRGSGKSTFIRRLLFHLRPQEIVRYAEIAVIDLISSSQISDELTNEIWTKVKNEIDKKNLLGGDKNDLIKLFSERFELFQRQVLNGFANESIEYQKLLNDFIRENLNDTKYCCEIISRYWKNQRKGLVIVLDNMDQLRPELQDICFLNSIEIAKKLGCLVIISMREERYYNAKSKGVLDAYHVPGFHINSPVIPDVIKKRLIYIIEKLNTDNNYLDVGITTTKQLEKITSFLTNCLNDLKKVNSSFSKFLRYSTHGDVRQALNFLKGFLTSGYTNINEMAAISGWVIKMHQIIKPMMIPDRFFYDEKNSHVPNVFQLRNDVNSSHFCGLRILNKLNQRSYDKASAGFLDVKFLLQIFDSNYDLKDDCIKHLDIFLSKGVVEANNKLEEFSDNVDQIRITSFGKYLLDILAFEFVYLDLTCLDCGIFDETFNNYLVKTSEDEVNMFFDRRIRDRVKSRIDRVDKFIEYLEKQETKEFNELGLPESEVHFSSKMRKKFEEQKPNILKSLANRSESDFINKGYSQINKRAED